MRCHSSYLCLAVSLVYFLLAPCEGGLYFPKRQYIFYHPIGNHGSQVLNASVLLLDSTAINCPDYKLQLDVSPDANTSKKVIGNALYLELRVAHNIDVPSQHDQWTVTVTIQCNEFLHRIPSYYHQFMETVISIQVVDVDQSPSWLADVTSGKQLSDDVVMMLCFGVESNEYSVVENNPENVRIDSFIADRKFPAIHGVFAEITPRTEYSDILEPSKDTVILKKSLDRETKDKESFELSCNLTYNGAQIAIHTKGFDINVVDMDDNAPYGNGSEGHLDQLVTYMLKRTSLQQYLYLKTYDADSLDLNVEENFNITHNDNGGIIYHLGQTLYLQEGNMTLLLTGVELDLERLDQTPLPYSFDVVVEDIFYQSSGSSNAMKKVIHRCVILKGETSHKDEAVQITGSLDFAAAKFSSVATLPSTDGVDGPYILDACCPEQLRDTLAVTTTGEIYVANVDQLSKYNGTLPTLLATVRRTVNGMDKDIATLKIELNMDLIPILECNTGCSVYNTEEACVQACGYGSPSGRCEWREGETTMSRNYSTCSPQLATCPDGVCSEREAMDFLICPQDCSTKPINGQLVRWKRPNGPDKQGIYMAKGPCWCEPDGDQYCQCDPLISLVPVGRWNSSLNTDLTDSKGWKGSYLNPSRGNKGRLGDGSATEASIGESHKKSESCGTDCIAAIAGSLSVVLVIAVLILLRWFACRRGRDHLNCTLGLEALLDTSPLTLQQCNARHLQAKRLQCAMQSKTISLKHVNSLVSMAAVPSDYVVDEVREQRAHGSRTNSSPSTGTWHNTSKSALGQDMFDDRWEFPRRYLTLEHVIGEGEFGQVVRAKAYMLPGRDEESVVAVKMLKPDATGTEYQDLVSEFQLLKEVDHPNVIKLLGVCTQKGPLYVIVEFCEKGSLRSFLRASKYKNKGSWEDKQNSGNDIPASEDKGEGRVLTARDLFGFAWQISKGMEYLAGLKIVHRDLAARNVLVADGLQLKISDFGLSRDVYEADTYLKMSKGRIPVKWMAPESLYAQVYTTKSDTWSYGIVLWEIVTLGASPYPGIPPERLFALLSTGYRMDRPDDCPEELYAIMQKCWKGEPENRPTFATLTRILDNLLQQNTEYLELSDDRYFSSSINSDSGGTRTSNRQQPHHSGYQNDPSEHYGNIVPLKVAAQRDDSNSHKSWSANEYEEEDEESVQPETSKLLVPAQDSNPHKSGTVQPDSLVVDIQPGNQKYSPRFNNNLVQENPMYVLS